MYFWQDLLEECNNALCQLGPGAGGIGRRQLFDDIRFMESEQGWSIPLERIKFGRKVFYRYEDSGFSIDNQPLSEKDLKEVCSALNLLNRIKGLPQLEWLEETMARLEKKLHLQLAASPVMSMDSNRYIVGYEHLERLFNAIYYKNALRIGYRSFTAEEAETIVMHPYHLHEYNNRWFLFGLDSVRGYVINLPSDRIKSIEDIDIPFSENTYVDFLEYFEDIVGVTRPEGLAPVDIRLKFSKQQAPYILTKPLHGSQRRISNNEQGLVVVIRVIPNHELDQLLLSFGEHIEVLEPLAYRNHLISRIKSAYTQYKFL